MITCGVALIDLLKAHGIDHVFGIPGVHTIELYRGLAGSGLRHITPRHEQGAGFMADGFARVSGRPAACFIITGPGMTNIATAMGQAYGDSIPMLVISAVNRRHELNLREGRLHEVFDQRGLVEHVSAFSHTLLRPSELPAVLEKAFAVMNGARPRPVNIEIPLDVFDLPADGMKTTTSGPPSKPRPDSGVIDRVCEKLKSAKRPVMLLGGGAVGADADIKRLAEALGAPTTLTCNAKGLLPPDHPLLLGPYGACRGNRQCVTDADVVLAIGTELGETDYGFDADPAFTTNGFLIRIDIEAEQTTRNALPDMAVISDAALAVEALVDGLAGYTPAPGGEDRVKQAHSAGTMNGLEPRMARHHQVLEAIRTALPDAIVVGDSTEPVYFGMTNYNADRPRSWFCSATGYGTLGYAVPAAVGAKLAAPERPVVALVGDGGLMYSVGEMASAVGADTPIIALLWNNQAFEEIKHAMVSAQVEPVGVELHAPDFLALARSMGWAADHVPDLDALPGLLKAASERNQPSLVEITPKTFGQDR